ncbi:hypothetical protein Mgra_00007675, partial [Meloidogyne graminicola]
NLNLERINNYFNRSFPEKSKAKNNKDNRHKNQFSFLAQEN